MNSGLSDEIIERMDLSLNLSPDEIMELIDNELKAESRKWGLSLKEREILRKQIYYQIRQLGVLQELIDDSEITEIMVNGTDNIFIEKHGKLIQLEEGFSSKEKLRQVIWQITADCNRVVNESSPIVDARLKDGARVNVVLDPVALNGPILTIRRFPPEPIKMKDLIEYGSITLECSDFIKMCVVSGLNILVSGGTGSGKTTFLNAISAYIPSDQRVITIEDSAELQLQNLPNLVRMETRNANVEGCREITIRDLLKTSLRMRPDRIIVGEVRSKECIDMLQSVNVGHSAMTTVHANSVRDVVSRLETMVLMGMEMPLSAIRGQIVSGFDLLIHLGRCEDGSRKVFEIAEPTGIRNGEVVVRTLFKLKEGKLIKLADINNEKVVWK